MASRLYGRGVADDKGQLYMLLSAARELAQAGGLPVNVRFACDGEEETGGNSIVEFLEADERGADAAIIFDSGMIREERPAFNIATRGLVYFHRGARRRAHVDLHSGMYRWRGAERRARADPHARAADRRRTGGSPSRCARGSSRRRCRSSTTGGSCQPGGDELADQGARPADPAAADEFYIRTFAEPALEVNGIESGSPHLEKTVLPVRASRERVRPARARAGS